MLPVAAGSCGLISLGTTSRDRGMFGPLERARRPSFEAACTPVAVRSNPSAASVVINRVIGVFPYPGEAKTGPATRGPGSRGIMRSAYASDFAVDQGLGPASD